MKLIKILLLGATTFSSLLAHDLWINTFDNLSKKKYVMIGLSRGHKLPIQDYIPGKIKFDSFDLVDPNNQTIELEKPIERLKKSFENESLSIVKSNLALQKVSFEESAIKGTYSVSLKRQKNFFTEYIDTKGKKRFKRALKKDIKGIKELISEKEINNFSKSYFVLGEWSTPQALGHDLEILPQNDISKLKKGDVLELKVLYKGKELESGYMTAKHSSKKKMNPFFSKIKKGKAKFIITNKGQWFFKTVHNKKEKINSLNIATATININ